jgi:phosphoserine phosphatase RsbU/P
MDKIAQLKITDNFGGLRVLTLDKPSFTIGRNPESDLNLLDLSVSRQHAKIVCEAGCYFLVDLESKSGSYVNDKRIERVQLKHLDRVQFGREGDMQIQFVEVTPASDAHTSRPTLDFQVDDSLKSGSSSSANEELHKLARFLEVNQAFRSSFSPEDVLRLIVDSAIEMSTAERGFLLLKNEAGELEIKVARDRARNTLQGDRAAISQSAVERAMKTNRSVVLNDDTGFDSKSGGSAARLDLRSIVCIPLQRFKMREQMGVTSLLRPEVIGLLYVDSRMVTGALSKTALTLLESLCFEVSKCLESVRLMGEEKEKQKLEQELAMAYEVQSTLLPIIFRHFDQFDVAAKSIPCRYVGGDFYDVITLEGGSVAFVLGDVSGKGISAALLAAVAQGGIQTQLRTGSSLADAVTNLNRVVEEKSAANRFITFFCGVLDNHGNFSYVNAGHNPPILARSDGRMELLSTKSLVLGAFDSAQYQALTTKVDAGDAIVMFTDGVTEAVNGSNEMFGDERLEKLVQRSVSASAEQIRDTIMEHVLEFTRGLPQGDDITLLAVKVKEGQLN